MWIDISGNAVFNDYHSHCGIIDSTIGERYSSDNNRYQRQNIVSRESLVTITYDLLLVKFLTVRVVRAGIMYSLFRGGKYESATEIEVTDVVATVVYRQEISISVLTEMFEQRPEINSITYEPAESH